MSKYLSHLVSISILSVLILVLFNLSTAVIAVSPVPNLSPTVKISPSIKSSVTPKPSSTPRPSSTPKPTSTPRLTGTPKPTPTPKNTPTSKPTPMPGGSGSADIAVTVASLSNTGLNLKGGDKTTLKAVINNLGNLKATNIKVKFLIDGDVIYEKNISSLSKNSKTTLSYSYLIPPNTATDMIFSVIVDPQNSITESSEDNNQAEKVIPVALAVRNLLIESLETTVSQPKPGQNISFKVKVKNDGTSKASQFKLSLFADTLSTTPAATIVIASLNAKASVTKNIPWTVPLHIDPSVVNTVRVTVDPDNQITETDETDNSKNYVLSLTVPDLSISPGEYLTLNGIIYPNTFSQMKFKLTNNNVIDLSGVAVRVTYALINQNNPRTKLAETTMSVKKNASSEYMFNEVGLPGNIPLGTQVYMFITADPDKNIPESNKSNNEIVIKRTMTERPPQAQFPYLFVTVEDEETGKLNSAVVTLTSVNVSGSPLTKTTGSDALTRNAPGQVVFDKLPDNATLTLNVSLNGYRTQTETITYDKNSEDSLYRTFVMDKRAVLSGVVKNNSGQVLPFASVIVEGSGLESTTDNTGKYGFMLNGGTYKIRFVKPGFGRVVENITVSSLTNMTLDKTLSPTANAYFYVIATNDEGVGLPNTDFYVNGNMIGTTATDGHFATETMSAGSKTFKFKKPGYVDTEFTETIEAGQEYNFSFVMYKPSTDNHVERGTQLVSWHQHEETPSHSFFVPEYKVDVWWGLGRVKMALDFTKTNSGAKLTKLVINNHGQEWECNKVEGQGDIETSAIDIPITIGAGSCTPKQTQMDVYKVAIESNGTEVWSDDSFWSSASDPQNTGTKTFTLNNLDVNWDNNFKIKMWVRVQKRAVVGTDGDGAGALVGYHLDKKLISWFPQKPPTTVIHTSWSQVGGYFLGILDNPVSAITSFTDLYSVESYNTYQMEDVLPQNFPGYINY
jgi:hypothetical protein